MKRPHLQRKNAPWEWQQDVGANNNWQWTFAIVIAGVVILLMLITAAYL